jgi:SAM-dependent methyltransferase
MKEEEIRPRNLFDRYLAIVDEDIEAFFSDKTRFEDCPCPACGSDSAIFAFEKRGFSYKSCEECDSLFLAPRPTEAMINDYYERGMAVKFWSTNFYAETLEARREKIYRPRATLIAKYFADNPGWRRNVFVDVGSGFGVFLEELSKQGVFAKAMGIEPAPNMAQVCRERGFEVVERPVESVGRGVSADFATSFEVLEHVHSPMKFLRAISDLLATGGKMLCTTLTITGFDLQVLWERSKSIYPPHHINLMSVKGLRRLIDRAGLRLVELSTPGRLDVDIVANAYNENQALELPRFVRVLLESTDKARAEFQSFLRDNLLSSHVCFIAHKTN